MRIQKFSLTKSLAIKMLFRLGSFIEKNHGLPGEFYAYLEVGNEIGGCYIFP